MKEAPWWERVLVASALFLGMWRLSLMGQPVLVADAPTLTSAVTYAPLTRKWRVSGNPDGRRLVLYPDGRAQLWTTEEGIPVTVSLGHWRRPIDAAGRATGDSLTLLDRPPFCVLRLTSAGLRDPLGCVEPDVAEWGEFPPAPEFP